MKFFPRLKQRWPSAEASLARSSQHCAEAQGLLNTLAKQDYEQAWQAIGLAVPAPRLLTGYQAARFPLESLRLLTPERQRNVLRWWLAAHGLDLAEHS